MKICFLQTDGSDLPYGKYSIENNKRYCNIHGYEFVTKPFDIDLTEWHGTWQKIFNILDVLEKSKYDYIFFLDTDAMIINKNIQIETLIDLLNESEHEMLIATNGLNGGELISTSGMLFKNTEKIKKFFESIIEAANTKYQPKKHEHFHEQDVVNYLYKEFDDVKSLIKPVEMDILNSWWLADIEDKSRFIYHFMARSNDEKAEIAKQLYEKHLNN